MALKELQTLILTKTCRNDRKCKYYLAVLGRIWANPILQVVLDLRQAPSAVEKSDMTGPRTYDDRSILVVPRLTFGHLACIFDRCNIQGSRDGHLQCSQPASLNDHVIHLKTALISLNDHGQNGATHVAATLAAETRVSNTVVSRGLPVIVYASGRTPWRFFNSVLISCTTVFLNLSH